MSDYDSPTGDTPMTQYAGEKGEATPYDEGLREGMRRARAKQYPYEEGGYTIIGPGTLLKDNTITHMGEIYKPVAVDVDRLIARVEEMTGTKTADSLLRRLLIEVTAGCPGC